MDNVGPFDRSAPQPPGLTLEQADGTGWMALYCLSMLAISLLLAEHDDAYEDVAVKFFEHYSMIVAAINDRGLWDESDGFYYDQVRRLSDGTAYPVRVRSMTGLLPLCAVASARRERVSALGEFAGQVRRFIELHPEYGKAFQAATGDEEMVTLALVDPDRLPRVLQRLADQGEFLSPHGIRSLSAAYRGEPFELWQDGHVIASVDYEPAESTTSLFGGNSNWRGPIWFPVNYPRDLGDRPVRAALRRRSHGRLPARIGPAANAGLDRPRPARAARVDLPARARTASARCSPGVRRRIATWADRLQFHEYFHGDDGRGLGASHQTGWTGLVADLVIRLSSDREARHDAPGARRPLRRDRRLVRRLLERRRRRRGVRVRRRRHRDAPRRWSSTRASSGAAASTGCSPARATATGSTGRMTRRPACAATRPSCCSTPTRGRSPGAVQWNDALDGDNDADSAPYMPRSVVCRDAFDWSGERRPDTALVDSVIYELHVKGHTMRHPQVPHELRGTYRALAHPAVTEHLLELGVTAVELLPVHQFVHDRFLADRGLRNYWGYQSIGYFAPHNEYGSADDGGGQIEDFKAMVFGLHAAGLQVILDVVYNHTAEGGAGRADAVLPRTRQRRLLPARRRPQPVRRRHRHRQHGRFPQSAGAAADHGLAALLGAGDARRRVSVSTWRRRSAAARPISTPTQRSWRPSARTRCWPRSS